MVKLKAVVGLCVALLCSVICIAEKQYTKESKLVKRLAPIKNTTAPPYVYNASKPLLTSIREVTDYTCGKRKLCEPTQGFFEYTASCYDCDQCSCDISCHLYGDCCNDFVTLGPEKNQTKYVMTCQEKKLDNRNRKHKEIFGVMMVSQCPKQYKNVSKFIVNKCENPDLGDMDQAKPVWVPSTGRTFKNKFCALCHQEERFKQWTLTVSCPSSEVFDDVNSQSDVWKAVLDSDDCTFTSKAPDKSIVHKCRLDLIDSCPASFKSKNATIAGLCENLTSVVFYDYKWYKNVFCAICNGASVNRRDKCNYVQDRRGPYLVPPLSVILNFYSDIPEQTQADSPRALDCPPSSVRNPVLGNCSSVLCPQRYIYVDSVCKPVFQSAAGLGYKFSLTLEPSNPVEVSTSGFIRRQYDSWLRERLHGYQPYVLAPLQIVIRGERALKPPRHVIVTGMDISFNIVSTQKIAMDAIKSDLRKLKQESWIFRPKDNIGIAFVSKFHEPGTDRDDVLLRYSNPGNSSVFGRRCKEGCLQKVEFLDISNNLECAYISFELHTLSNSNVFLRNSSLTRHNKTVLLEKGTFKTFGGKIEICVSQLKHIQELFKDTIKDILVPKHDILVPMHEWLSIISTVCLSVSCVFLVLTCIVYLLVPELQTLPGRNTMGLVLFLFLAQLLYLTGIQATDYQHLCQTIGITMHYFWLVSFFWMFICAFHMHSIVTNMVSNAQSHVKSLVEREKFIHYTILACAGPVVLVGGCIGYSLARTDGSNIGYGGELCFINSNEARGIFFAAPLLLVLILNVFLYVRTVIVLKRMPDIVAHNKPSRNYAAIYFRIAVLLGLGWIFGFLPFDWSRLLFAVLTGGQGVFIFFSVCVNRAVVRSLCRKTSCFREHFLFQNSNFYTSSTMSAKDKMATNSF